MVSHAGFTVELTFFSECAPGFACGSVSMHDRDLICVSHK